MYTSEDLVRIRNEKGLTQQELAEKLGISRELVVKMESKEKSISKATKILLDNFLGEKSTRESTTDEKYVRLLERNVQSIEKQNLELTKLVEKDLKTVLDNQLALTVLFESYLKSLAALLIEDGAAQQEFRLTLHREAFERLKDLRKTGNHIEIDKTDIVSK